MEPEKKLKPTIWGYVALAATLFLLFVPRILFFIPAFGAIILAIIGLAVDGNKWPSGISILFVCFMFYSVVGDELGQIESQQKEQSQKSDIYTVRYIVSCVQCSITYTNETGGNDKATDWRGNWQRDVKIRGSEFVYLSAQNGNVTSNIIATIQVITTNETGTQSIHGLKSTRSSGEYAIASASGYPYSVLK